MAVYTKISDEALNEFLSCYDIGKVVACKGIAEGIENSNYKLSTSMNHYILTLYEKRVDSRQLPFFLGLMDYLSEHDIPCPRPVQATDGAFFRKLCGKSAAVFSFLPGDWPRHLTPEHCQELGGWLGRLHIAGKGYSGRRRNDLSVADWRGLLAACERQATDDISAGLYDELLLELDYLETHWPRDLPCGIIHGDLFPDNVFFAEGRITGLIDFYFACHDALAYDLAVCLNAWCFDRQNRFVTDRAAAMLNQYTTERSLSRIEREALPLLARGAAMRFLLTRVYDWVNTPEDALVMRKSPREFLDKLRFHRQIRDYKDYGLEMPQ